MTDFEYRALWSVNDETLTLRQLIGQAASDLQSMLAVSRATLTASPVFTITIAPGRRPELTAAAPAVRREPRRRSATRPACGTDSGYHHHLKRARTEPCEPCRAAHATAERARAARRALNKAAS